MFIVGAPVDDDIKDWVEQTIANSTSENEQFDSFCERFYVFCVVLVR